MPVEVISFDEAIARSEGFARRHLIIGNGFSIAARPNIFTYGSLFDRSGIDKHQRLGDVFRALTTTDFEVAIRSLEQSAKLAYIYSDDPDTAIANMLSDAAELKNILITTLGANHPDGPLDMSDSEFRSCREFLANFISGERPGKIFSVNYDLLLYWTLMRDSDYHEEDDIRLDIDDGFGNDDDEPDADYVVWHGETRSNTPSVFYLHGALHLFDAGRNLQKFTWIRTDERLLNQARSAMDTGRFPLFVAEGTNQQKMDRIRHNAYLYQGLKTVYANARQGTHCFFIHGHSLAENDNHIFRLIGVGRCRKIFVSVFGNIDSETNQEVVQNVRRIQQMRQATGPELEVEYYDAESAQVWNRY